MKLHAFDAEIDETRLRALTRDRAGRALKGPLLVNATGQVIQPSAWKYHGVISTTGIVHDKIRDIHQRVRSQGVVVGKLPPRLKHFYVFDVRFDGEDVRVYSADKDLREFRAARRRLELSPKGHLFGGEPEELVGEVEISSRLEAEQMGVNYDELQMSHFTIRTVRRSDASERLRRGLQREVTSKIPEWEEQLGIRITHLSVDEVKFKDTTESSTPSTDVVVDFKDIGASNSLVQTPVVVPAALAEARKPIAPASDKPRTHTDRLIDHWKNNRVVAIVIIVSMALGGVATAVKSSAEIFAFLAPAWAWMHRFF